MKFMKFIASTYFQAAWHYMLFREGVDHIIASKYNTKLISIDK